MTYRRFAWREIGWGGAAALLASMGLAGCDSGGSGGCPEIEGSWSVQSTCEGAPTSCEIEQNGCKVELYCGEMMLEGKVSKSSVSFKNDDISCNGKLDGLEDDDEDGMIYPTFEADCNLGGDMCEVVAACFEGDCTEPEDDNNDNGGDGDGDGDGDGPAGQGGAAGAFSGSGGFSGTSGAGGFSGEGAGGFSGTSGAGGFSGEGAGGFSGIGGEGGFSGTGGIGGEGGGPAGSGGTGGISSDGACGSCLHTECATELTGCTSANGCAPAINCLLDNACYFDDSECVDAYCASIPEPGEEGLNAVVAVFDCTEGNCISECTSGSIPEPPVQQACDTCQYWGDGFCDDGSQGGTVYCEVGTDCTDCGAAQ